MSPRRHMLDRVKARDVVDRVGLRVVESNPLGITIRRVTGPGSGPVVGLTRYSAENWRVQCGGGIAGHSGAFWIAPLNRGYGEPLGPFYNKRDLEAALRMWRRWETP